MGRLGRPKAKKTVTVGIRLTEVEAANLRRIAIAEDITMSEFVRQSINRRMKRLKELGQWTMETERGTVTEIEAYQKVIQEQGGEE